ncbi:MAG: class I SAM-dependent methyltransferase [Caldilineaceae bacterium]
MDMHTATVASTVPPRSGFAGFFSGVQDAPWYRLFLAPALAELQGLPAGSRVLDVGTGPGRFIELGMQQLALSWVGVDTDEAMLAQARRRPTLDGVPLRRVEPAGALPFDDRTFDAVCLCSVLFTIPDPEPLLGQALRLLRPHGKIIVLTPSGRADLRTALTVPARAGGTIRNWTFFLWYAMTRSGARRWTHADLLADVTRKQDIVYHKRIVFEGLAVLETLEPRLG